LRRRACVGVCLALAPTRTHRGLGDASRRAAVRGAPAGPCRGRPPDRRSRSSTVGRISSTSSTSPLHTVRAHARPGGRARDARHDGHAARVHGLGAPPERASDRPARYTSRPFALDATDSRPVCVGADARQPSRVDPRFRRRCDTASVVRVAGRAAPIESLTDSSSSIQHRPSSSRRRCEARHGSRGSAPIPSRYLRTTA
jgi:hypothetical protein